MTALPFPLAPVTGAERAAPRIAIPFLQPVLPPLAELTQDFERIYEARIFSNGGQFEKQLSSRLASWLGVKHALPVANATQGLELAIAALARPIPHGKVLMPSFTFVATALAAEACGFAPLFCDVFESSWQAKPDIAKVAARRDEISLILLCNTFGAPADIDAWSQLACELELPMLIDSAPGLGASYVDGRRQGASGFTEVFSMHATKTFAVGEGGVITTDDDALAARLGRMRNFGFDEQRLCREQGTNAKLSEMQAAIGCRVLDRFEGVVEHRRRRAAEYRARLAPKGFEFQQHGELSAYQFVPVRVPRGIEALWLQQKLAAVGIETRRYFAPALHGHPHFEHTERLEPLTVTAALQEQMLSLPMSNRLRTDEVDRVCDAVLEAVKGS